MCRKAMWEVKSRELNHVLMVEGLDREPEAQSRRPSTRNLFPSKVCSEGLGGHEFGRLFSSLEFRSHPLPHCK